MAGALLSLQLGCGSDVSAPTCAELPTLQERRACWAAGGIDEQRCGDGVVTEYLAQDVRFDFEDDEYPSAFSGDWFVQREQTGDNALLRHEGLDDNESSQFQWTTEVVAPSVISFRLRVSSEANYDYLRFYIDGLEQDRWAGEVPWREAAFDVAPGTRTFEWRYAKDSSLSRGEDSAFVDDIALIAADAVVEECDDGNTVSGDGCSELCALE